MFKLNKYFRKNVFYSFALIVPVLIIFFSCAKTALTSSVSFCDNHNGKVCQSPQADARTYSISVPDSKKGSWYDLGYYMYFHTRQTPGIYVAFNRKLTEEEFLLFKESIKCNYRLFKGEDEISGHMEGLHMDESRSGFWCFDYLGTMLVSFHKKYKTIKAKPGIEFFPVKLELSYSSSVDGVRGFRLAEIKVNW
jgi:hypothetical protein